ncbi:hypothetical protein ABF86_12525 [Nitrosomonas sp. GH22]|nr:hypothetical protein [Nitrosomonas sp. GH22]
MPAHSASHEVCSLLSSADYLRNNPPIPSVEDFLDQVIQLPSEREHGGTDSVVKKKGELPA